MFVSGEFLAKLDTSQLHSMTVYLNMPKFKITSTLMLQQFLIEMGRLKFSVFLTKQIFFFLMVKIISHWSVHAMYNSINYLINRREKPFTC